MLFSGLCPGVISNAPKTMKPDYILAVIPVKTEVMPKIATKTNKPT